VVAMFAGVYALGIAIIGFYHTTVSRPGRAGFIAAAVLLSVPGMLLMPLGTTLGVAGVEITLYTLTNDIVLRVVGGVLLAVLLVANRRQAAGETPSTTESTTSTAEPTD